MQPSTPLREIRSSTVTIFYASSKVKAKSVTASSPANAYTEIRKLMEKYPDVNVSIRVQPTPEMR